MATAAATMPEVFVRKSSGLVRVMSPRSAFVYNVLTMGLIFPWTYLWAPAVLPGGQLVWGILLAMALEIPIALAYVWLSTALPRSGGDYVFQSRVLGGGIGFTLVFSGFVIWILQWVALSGWLLSALDLRHSSWASELPAATQASWTWRPGSRRRSASWSRASSTRSSRC